MADKEKLQFTIEAIDNFSKVLDKLNQSLEKGNVEIKIKVNEASLKTSLDTAISKINQNPPSINVKINSKDVSKQLKSELSNEGVTVKVNQDKFKDSIDSAKKKLTDFISSVHKIVVTIDNDKLQRSIDSASKKIEKLTGKERKVKIDTDARKITTKLQNISGRLDTISKKGFTINGDIKTGNIESKIIRLATYINQLNSKDIAPKVDKGISEIVKLSTYMNQLGAKKLNPEIDVNIDKAKSGVQAIFMMLQDLKKEKYKIQLDTSDLTNKNSQLKTTANTLKNLASSLKTIKSKKINLDFKSGELGQIVKTIRNLNKELTSVKNNIIINIRVNDGDTITKLKEISTLLRDIKRNSRININTRGSSRIGGYGGRLEPNVGTAMAGWVQFLGRSSKGFGSFLEAMARVSENFMSFGGTVEEVGLARASMGKLGVSLAVLTGIASTFAVGMNLAASSVQQFGNILITIGNAIYNALKPGIDLYKQQQSAIFSFTAALQSNGILPDGTSLRSMGVEGRNIARGISTELIERATFDAEMSALNLKEILTALQGVMPLLMQLGMSAEQAYEVTKGVAGVAKFTQLAPNQVLQEVRDLAQGSITARTSQVANALGITNEDLAQYKGNADDLFEYLMGKFKEYSELLNEFEDTAVGRFQQLEERWANVAKNIVDGIAPQFKGLFESLIEETGRWVDKNGNYFDAIKGEWHNAKGEFLATIDDIKNAEEGYKSFGIDFDSKEFQLSEPLEKAKQALIEIIEYAAQTLDFLVAWTKEAFNFNDPIDGAKTIIERIIDLFATSVIMLEVIVGLIYKFKDQIIATAEMGLKIVLVLSTIPPILRVIIDAALIIDNLFQALIYPLLNVKSLLFGIAEAFNKILAGDFSGAMSSLTGQFDKMNEDLVSRVEKSWDTLGKDFNSLVDYSYELAVNNPVDELKKLLDTETKSNGWFTEAINKEKNQQINKGDIKGKTAADLRGTPKEDTKALEKANKDAIKQSQKELKARLAELKTLLADKLDDLKDILDKNKIAYDEGFMGVEDYFKNKAGIERQEAQAKLDEALAERELITNALYDNEEDREKALAENQKTVNKSTKELNKANTKIEGLTRAISENSVMLRNYNNYFKALNKQNQLGKNKVNYSSSPISSATQLGQGESELARLAVDLAVRAKELNGSDLDVGKILGLFFAETTTENGRGTSLNWRENKNPAGFTANSSTPDNMVDWGGGRGPGEGGDYETFVNVSYDDMLNHIIKTWFKWYEEELSSNTSVADMNAGMQGIFHEANFDRSDIYEEGIDYARSHGLYEAVANNLMSASDSLVSASNNLSETTSNLGQTTNIIQGLVGQGDTWDIWGIDQEEIDSMSERGQAMISTIAKMFRDYFGGDTQMLITSGNRGSGEHFGDSIDFDVIKDGVSLILDDESREVIRSLVHSIGAGAADEVTYTEYSTGPHIHANASGKDWAEIVHGYGLGYYGGVDPTKGFIENIGTSVQTEASSSTDESELRKIKKEFRDYVSSLRVAVEERTLDGVSAQVQQIQLKYKEEIRKLEGQWSTSKDPETLKLLDESRDLLSKKMAIEVNDAISGSIDKQLDYTLSQIDRMAGAREVDIYRGKVDYGQLISNALSDINDKYGLGKLLEELHEYENIFIEAKDFTKALDIKNKIDSAKEKLYDLFSGWIEQGQKYWDNAEAIFNATDRFTPTQKEFAEREFNAYRAQRKYADRTALGNQLQNRYNAEIKAYKELVKIQKELVKGSDAYLANEKKITEALQDTKRTEALIAENEQLKKIAELTSKMPDYLDDLKKTARDALDNGLTEFLTDGILEAESLGDALRDLAYNILKEIQEMSAKWIVKGLMNSLFGTFDTEAEMNQATPAYLQQGQEIIASITTGTQQIVNAILGNNQLGMTPNYMMMGQQPPSLGMGNYATSSLGGLGAFSQPWNQSPLNPNYSPWSTPYGWSMRGLGLGSFGIPSVGGFGMQSSGMLSPFSAMYGFGGGSSLFGGFGAEGDSLIDYNRLQESVTSALDTFSTTFSPIMDAISDGISGISYNSDYMNQVIDEMTAEQFQHDIVSELDTGDLVYSNDNIEANTGAMAGIGGTLIKTVGGMVKAYGRNRQSVREKKNARGGYIVGEGTETSDSIPAMLSNGEYVINAENTRRYKPILDLINKGLYEVDGYADGGEVGDVGDYTQYTDESDGIVSMLQVTNSILSSILMAVSSLVPNNEETVDTTEQDATQQQQDTEPYTSYSKSHKSSKGIGDKLQSFVNWIGLGNDNEDNRLVDTLGDDVDKPTKMIVDLLQTIADNTYTLVNLLTVIATIDFMKSVYNIITHGIKGIGMKHGGVVKLAKGGAVYHNNGLITGPGSSTSDSIPAMLSNGEAVLNAKAVKELGLNFINSVNNGQFAKIKAKLPHFADGGFMGEAYQSTARGMTDFAKNIGSSVTTNNQMNIALVRDEREAMAHFMKSPQGQKILVDFQKGNGRVFSRFNNSF